MCRGYKRNPGQGKYVQNTLYGVLQKLIKILLKINKKHYKLAWVFPGHSPGPWRRILVIKKPLFTCPGRHISGWFILSENWRSQTCPERWGHLTSHRAMKLPLPTHPLISERSAPASLTLEGMPHPLLRAKLALSHDSNGYKGSTWYVMAVSPADPEPCPECWAWQWTENGIHWTFVDIPKLAVLGKGLLYKNEDPSSDL